MRRLSQKAIAVWELGYWRRDDQPGPVAHQGPPPAAKPRLLQDGRDMFWSLAPLVLACVVLAGLVGMCSFQATGPKTGPVPDIRRHCRAARGRRPVGLSDSVTTAA